MKPETEYDGRGERMVRPAEAIRRLAISKSTFWLSYIKTGRVQLRRLGAKAVGFPESELLALMRDLPDAEKKPRSSQMAATAAATMKRRGRPVKASPEKPSTARGFNRAKRKAEREAVRAELRKLREVGIGK